MSGHKLPVYYHLYYSADLWVGANVDATIEKGNVDSMFVNANSYSANEPGSVTMNGGSVGTMYLEYDSGYGAVLNYNSGDVSLLLISTTTYGETFTPLVLLGSVSGNLDKYEGGVNPNPDSDQGDDPILPDPGEDDDDGQVM